MTTLNNKLFLLGHVGQDPEIRVLDSGRKMAKFSLATNEIYLNSLGEKVEKAYWHKIVFWNRVAEVVEKHVHKGTRLVVEGHLTYRSWEDESGVKHYRTEVVGRGLMLL